MDIFANRLRARARQLGISNAEAARRAGLEERRYGHYIVGRCEPDLATFKKIAAVLATTPNWLLDAPEPFDTDSEKSVLFERLRNAAGQMTKEQLALCVIQAETAIEHDK